MDIWDPRGRSQNFPLRFMCVHLMSVCGLEKQRQPGCRQRNKEREVFEHERLQVEGVDSSFYMQNAMAGNLLAGNHKPVLEATPLPLPRQHLLHHLLLRLLLRFCGQSSL